ncbi:hypothetical protein AVEN_213174-1 [Araneus ventricosus]|uniref:Uncharacterized protein n=1 Tax=Araneus ventricosus TaxID=182803 RepID=A0A4Y2I517_ARAVE|nr:hypothetical protein AVEN_213174-1 [Araneus ventricosus]
MLFAHHVISALDRNKVSDRKAAALGEDASSLSISRSTVHRVRKKARREFVDVVAKNYAPKHPLTIHWGTKILPNIVGVEIVDRLPVIVSGDREEKLLGVPKLSSGTGKKKCSRSNLQNTGAMGSC